jgi:hypothetical protein
MPIATNRAIHATGIWSGIDFAAARSASALTRISSVISVALPNANRIAIAVARGKNSHG